MVTSEKDINPAHSLNQGVRRERSHHPPVPPSHPHPGHRVRSAGRQRLPHPRSPRREPGLVRPPAGVRVPAQGVARRLQRAQQLRHGPVPGSGRGQGHLPLRRGFRLYLLSQSEGAADRGQPLAAEEALQRLVPHQPRSPDQLGRGVRTAGDPVRSLPGRGRRVPRSQAHPRVGRLAVDPRDLRQGARTT